MRKVESWRNSLFQKFGKIRLVLSGIYARRTNRKITKRLGITLRRDWYSNWWKPNTQSTSWCLAWSLAMSTLCLHLFSHRASHSIWKPNSIAGEVVLRVSGYWKTLRPATGPCHIKQDNPIFVSTVSRGRIFRLYLCKGARFANKWAGFDTKQSHGEALEMLELWGMRSTPSLSLLPGPRWTGMVAPDRVRKYGSNRIVWH